MITPTENRLDNMEKSASESVDMHLQQKLVDETAT